MRLTGLYPRDLFAVINFEDANTGLRKNKTLNVIGVEARVPQSITGKRRQV